MPYARTNSIDTHYEESGQGPPVVLIHGHSADLRLWDPQVPALVGSGYRVIRYDVRGHGRSSVPPTGYTWDNYSRDLGDLLHHIDIRPPSRTHLVGLSMGGAVAMQFALDQPEGMASLTLADSALPGLSYSEEFSRAIEELLAAVRREGPRAALERLWLTHPLFDGIRRFPERFALLKSILLEYPAADYLDETEYPQPERQIVDRLEEIHAPTLVLVGELHLPDFRLAADILAANIPGARLHVLADAGHVSNLEQPEAFNEALIGFLKGLSPHDD
jgi:3-oxoadipate enol-lactonase